MAAAIVVLLSSVLVAADDFDLALHEMSDCFKLLLKDFLVVSLEL